MANQKRRSPPEGLDGSPAPRRSTEADGQESPRRSVLCAELGGPSPSRSTSCTGASLTRPMRRSIGSTAARCAALLRSESSSSEAPATTEWTAPRASALSDCCASASVMPRIRARDASAVSGEPSRPRYRRRALSVSSSPSFEELMPAALHWLRSLLATSGPGMIWPFTTWSTTPLTRLRPLAGCGAGGAPKAPGAPGKPPIAPG
mmetsp:Transcript_14401/g.36847  ORF Transcript_14401/g.36847 Transcript_14401/m.36847 type:complete len:205 (+) Transcript_14401:101-715(+)